MVSRKFFYFYYKPLGDPVFIFGSEGSTEKILMNIFIFNNSEEFGLFAKINLDSLKAIVENKEKTIKLGEFVNVFNNARGGCGCSIEGRQRAANNLYVSFVPSFFSENERVIRFMKEALGNADVIEFKKSGGDQSGFFLI